MANVQRLKEIRDYLRTMVPEPEFDMTTFGTVGNAKYMTISCNTPACVAGHVCFFYNLEADRMGYAVGEVAGDALGLDPLERRALFHVKGVSYDRINKITPQEAAEVLDNYLDTGVFDWVKVLNEEQETKTEIPELVPA